MRIVRGRMDNRIAGAALVLVVVVGLAALLLVLLQDEPVPEAQERAQPPEEQEEPAEPDAAEGPPEPEPEPGPEPEPPEPEPVVETVAEGLDQPWGLAFLPDGRHLVVTQAPGRLSVVDTETGSVLDIAGVPEVDARGQGGLLDVAVGPDFPDTGWLHLTYAAGDGTGAAATHLARGRLDLEGQRLDDLEPLFVAEPFRTGGLHFGSRITFGADGDLFMTIGDRGDKDFDDHVAQDRSNTLGTTIRLAADGSVPEGNPFVGDPDVADEIYTYGHRNVQGMAVRPGTGEVWQSEHGEEDGDEINVLQAGGNHGWPIAHTGCEYGTDIPIGDDPAERDDVVDPVHFWECGTGGFAPAGMTFYVGEQFAAWEGDLLVGGLAPRYLARFTVDDGRLEEQEPLLDDQGWRIRDVVVGPQDGAIYVAIDGDGVPLVRLVNGAGPE